MITHRRRGLMAALASGAVLTIVLSGCASGDDAPSDGTDTEAAKGTLTVGISSALSGPVGPTGSAIECGAQAYFASVNADGGFNGFDIKVESKDSQFDPTTAATIARDFASAEVDAVLVFGTQLADASRPTLEGVGIPMFVVGDGAAHTPPKSETEFNYNPVYVKELKAAMTFLHEDEGHERISLVSAGGGGGQAVADAWETGELGAELGFEQGPAGRIPVDTQDFSGFAQQLKDGGATAVFSTLQETGLANLQKAADAIGYHPAWVANGFGYGPAYKEAVGALADGIFVAQWSLPSAVTDDPTVEQYLSVLESYGDSCDPSAPNVAIGYNLAAIIGYALDEATKDGTEATSDAIVAALQLDGQPIGTIPSVTFNSASHAAVQEVSFWQVDGDGMTQSSDWISLSD